MVPDMRERTPALDDATVIDESLLDAERFGELYDRYALPVHRFVASRIGSQAADDVVAETFLAAFDGRHRYDLTHRDARPWLLGIATRQVSRRRRQERAYLRLLAGAHPEPETENPDDAVAAAVAAAATRRPLVAALGRLKPADRDVLLLVAWADLTYLEVAGALEIPVGTVRSRLHRARRIVRSSLGDTDPLQISEDA
jgi:RNA polymerase sigma factor (sigma-70 family)